jgi:hypothetical protein
MPQDPVTRVEDESRALDEADSATDKESSEEISEIRKVLQMNADPSRKLDLLAAIVFAGQRAEPRDGSEDPTEGAE